VLGAQVAVAVAHEAARDAVLELLVARMQEGDSETVRRRELARAHRLGKGKQRPEVLAHGRRDRAGIEAARGRRLRVAVELRDPPRHGTNDGRIGVPSRHSRSERAALVKPSHLDDMLVTALPRSAERPSVG
jgi:hypothetical protein